MNQERIKKLEGSVQSIIAPLIFEEAQEVEEVHGVVTITGVKISSDLSYIDVFISCFVAPETLAHDIAQFTPAIQKRLNKSLDLYKLPRIRFRYDESGEVSVGIEKLMKSIQDELSS
jgi:ribosome-binding factor A